MKRFLKILLSVVLAVAVLAAGFILYLTVREYRLDGVEPAITRESAEAQELPGSGTLKLMSWNTGYAALGKDQDFAMDGGGKAPAASKAQVAEHLEGMAAKVREVDPDILLLQEIDLNSSRSYRTDHREYYQYANDAVGLNYVCDFVPYPWPPLGKIESGVFTASDHDITGSERIALPCPFSWPLRVANLKRCLLVSHFPVEGSDHELVLINTHLEAYDSGEGKIAQTNMLMEFVQAEYAKGNWVIVGGDWNQNFPGSLELYPNEHPDLWEAGVLGEDVLPEGWSFAYDMTTPTCRLLNQPYDPADTANTQYYVIDGFMISPNVELQSVETLDEGFVHTDHNPVVMEVELR